MFEESLIESTHRIHTDTRRTAAISLAFQAAIAATIIMVPLLHPDTIKHITRRIPNLVAPIPPPRPTPPQLPRLRITNASITSAPAAPAAPAQPSIADLIRNSLHTQVDLTPASTNVNIAAIGTGSGTGTNPAGLPAGLGTGTTPTVRPAGPSARPRVSSGVSAGLLITPMRPIYPEMAKLTRTQGSVVVEAIISKSGNIEAAHVISGPVMLQSAAIDAVRNARYRPYLLNGEPTEVATTITVNFKLGN